MNQRRLARCDVFQSNNRGRQVSIVPGVTGLPGPCCRKLCGKFCRKLREIICLWQAGKMQAHGRQELDVSSFLNEKSIQMTPVPRAMQDICPKYKVNCVGHNLDKILSLLGETYSKGNMSAHLAFLKAVISKHLLLSPCVLISSNSNRCKCCNSAERYLVFLSCKLSPCPEQSATLVVSLRVMPAWQKRLKSN